MTATPWPCTQCGQPGVRNLGTDGYCDAHLDALYDSFGPAVFGPIGIGRIIGDGTNGHHQLGCRVCSATWIGPAGEQCWWCERTYVAMLQYQVELVLRAPEVDRADTNYDNRMTAWTERVAVAVKAGIIDAETARRTIAREVTRAA